MNESLDSIASAPCAEICTHIQVIQSLVKVYVHHIAT